MVSEYLNLGISLEEIDALFERDREIAAAITATTFKHDVSFATATISEINQISNACIRADSQVAVAKMLTSADVSAAQLMSKAQIAILEILQLTNRNPDNIEIHHKIIADISDNTTKAISARAEAAIISIRGEAEAALSRIKTDAAKAIGEINALAAEVEARVAENTKIAMSKLSEAKGLPRSSEDAVRQAKAAKKVIEGESTRASLGVRNLVERRIADLNASTDEAINSITEALNNSERRVNEALAGGLSRISGVISTIAGK